MKIYEKLAERTEHVTFKRRKCYIPHPSKKQVHSLQPLSPTATEYSYCMETVTQLAR